MDAPRDPVGVQTNPGRSGTITLRKDRTPLQATGALEETECVLDLMAHFTHA